eukprot:TRINITY_DN9247_c0_g2_i1.p1 TRINITY_DN9247_c0_g2~~TRINITY_DN9247_c0_g2_i1.p1  ORF type:complete len:655 (-),score=78.45 TRINITY_DN9247_c0_g2_i1:42-2006(-)
MHGSDVRGNSLDDGDDIHDAGKREALANPQNHLMKESEALWRRRKDGQQGNDDPVFIDPLDPLATSSKPGISCGAPFDAPQTEFKGCCIDCEALIEKFVGAIRGEMAATQTAIIDTVSLKAVQICELIESDRTRRCRELFSSEQGAAQTPPLCCDVHFEGKNPCDIHLTSPERLVTPSAEGHANRTSKSETSRFKTRLTDAFDDDFSASPPYPHFWACRSMAFPGWRYIEKALVMWYSIKEPQRKGFIYNVVSSSYFDLFFAMIIFMNLCFLVSRINQSETGTEESGKEEPAGFFFVDSVFAFLFFVELAIKLLHSGWYFFANGDAFWNWLDFCLVTLSVIDLFLPHLMPSQSFDPSITRIVRFVRLVKMLRLVRVMRLFKTLRTMIDALCSSGVALLWCVVMIFAICVMFALVFAHLTRSGVAEEDVVMSRLGTVQAATFTLFQLTSGGADWGETYTDMAVLGGGAQFLFLFFVCFTQIAVLNVVTGMFVNTAFTVSADTKEELVEKLEGDYYRSFHALTDLAREFIVQDDSGTFSCQELSDSLGDHTVRGVFSYHGINIVDAALFFDVFEIDAAGGRMDVNVFVHGCLAFRGFGSEAGFQALSFQMNLSHEKLKQLEYKSASGIRELQERTRFISAHMLTLNPALPANVREL